MRRATRISIAASAVEIVMTAAVPARSDKADRDIMGVSSGGHS
jgi:hypothetical protein